MSKELILVDYTMLQEYYQKFHEFITQVDMIHHDTSELETILWKIMHSTKIPSGDLLKTIGIEVETDCCMVLNCNGWCKEDEPE